MAFTFYVGYSTHDHVKEGITVLNTSCVTVLAASENEASLLALQMVAARGFMVTQLSVDE